MDKMLVKNSRHQRKVFVFFKSEKTSNCNYGLFGNQEYENPTLKTLKITKVIFKEEL